MGKNSFVFSRGLFDSMASQGRHRLFPSSVELSLVTATRQNYSVCLLSMSRFF